MAVCFALKKVIACLDGDLKIVQLVLKKKKSSFDFKYFLKNHISNYFLSYLVKFVFFYPYIYIYIYLLDQGEMNLMRLSFFFFFCRTIKCPEQSRAYMKGLFKLYYI